jgi:hypothetical protein
VSVERCDAVSLLVESDTQTKAYGRAASNARKVGEMPGMDLIKPLTKIDIKSRMGV